MANVHGLFSSRKDDSSDDESNNRYVGGINSRGGGSGLAVEPSHDTSASGAPRDSVFELAEQGGSDDSSQVRRTITMYREGFIVDDGPYRRLDDPENASFLRSLAIGRTPTELMEDESGGNVVVGLIDKRQEDYAEPFRSFSGAGATLGNSSTVTGSTVDPANLPEAIPLDEGRPSTSIQVRLPNGKRQVIKVNLDVPVLQLAVHVAPLLEGLGGFQLISGFPPKPLEDFSLTIDAAGLKGAQVQVKQV